MASCKAGQEKAFGHMGLADQKGVDNIVCRMLGNKEEAKDLAQEVFLSVFESIKDFREETRFEPFEEIVLRTSDPKKSILEIGAKVNQFEGEIVGEEVNILLASLPISSFYELKKETEESRISERAEGAAPQREAWSSLKLSPKAEKERGEKENEGDRPMAGSEGRMSIRFIVIKEPLSLQLV
ncbi:MAG: RNA polymerase sigma factor [Thermodesulfobacteriota bacterium]